MRCVLAVAIVILAFPAPGAAATRPGQLWRAYPLGTQKLTSSPSRAHQHKQAPTLAPSQGTGPPATEEEFSVGLIQVIAITGIVAAVAVLAPTAIIRRRTG
jgi:hypothetical protein